MLQILSFIRQYGLTALLITLSSFLTYHLTHTTVSEPCVTKAISEVTSAKTSMDTKSIQQKMVQIVKEPDGTQITTTTNTAENDHAQEVDKVETKTETESNPYSPARYSFDLTTRPLDYKDIKIGAGARLGNLPVFGVIEYETRDHTARIGLRGEF